MAVAGGPLRLYSSKDLKTWKAEAMQDDIITECPEIYYLPVEGTNEHRYVLSEGGRWYKLGIYKKQMENGHLLLILVLMKQQLVMK